MDCDKVKVGDLIRYRNCIGNYIRYAIVTQVIKYKNSELLRIYGIFADDIETAKKYHNTQSYSETFIDLKTHLKSVKILNKSIRQKVEENLKCNR